MDMQTIFGGVYASHAFGTVLYDARMLVGQMTHDLTRRVSTGETAESEYSSLLLSPEVGVATTLHVTDTLDVLPRLRLRYAGLFTQGFRERAMTTDWDIQYEKRTMHLVEGRAEVGVPVTLANGGQINPRVGVEGRWLLAGSKIKARSLNRDISPRRGRRRRRRGAHRDFGRRDVGAGGGFDGAGRQLRRGVDHGGCLAGHGLPWPHLLVLGFEGTQNRFDFGPDGLRDEERSRPDRAPQKRIAGGPLSRIHQHGHHHSSPKRESPNGCPAVQPGLLLGTCPNVGFLPCQAVLGSCVSVESG